MTTHPLRTTTAAIQLTGYPWRQSLRNGRMDH